VNIVKVLVALAAGCALSLGLHAQPQSNAPGQSSGQQGQQRHGPPPEAVAACKSQAAGAACSFTSPHGVVKGSCWAPEGKPLACRPYERAQAPGSAGSSSKPSGPPRQ
jgi:hypothetical protein